MGRDAYIYILNGGPHRGSDSGPIPWELDPELSVLIRGSELRLSPWALCQGIPRGLTLGP